MIKPRNPKGPSSSSKGALGELDVLRKEAIERNDPKEKLAKIKEISACTVASSPALALLMAAKLAFGMGLESLLSMNFETERVKQPFPKGDWTFSFWQFASECALRGALWRLMIPWLSDTMLQCVMQHTALQEAS